MKHAQMQMARRSVIGVVELLLVAFPLSAQSPIAYSPYDIDAFIALENPADLRETQRQSLTQSIRDLSRAHVGAAWTVKIHFAEGELLGELLTMQAAVDLQRLLDVTPRHAGRHKAFYITLRKGRSQWQARMWELDFRTYRLSPPTESKLMPHAQLAPDLLDLMVETFSPVAELAATQRDTVEGTLQAAALVVDSDSPVLLDVGDPLLGVIRHNDRLGRADPSRVLTIPWTVLETIQIEQQRLHCQIHSAHRNPLGRKTRLRLVRYAQAARYRPTPVDLTLQTPNTTPLIDYEILQRNAESEQPILLGRTNEQGIVRVPAGAARWQMLYVRHGDRVLARLPIIAGMASQLSAELPSDDLRLAAEGFVTAFRQEVIDAVARRQILATRIRSHIAAGQFDVAEQLLQALGATTSADEYARRLEKAHGTFLAQNARAQQLIDQMFADTRQVLERYLDRKEVRVLSQQLAAARAEN